MSELDTVFNTVVVIAFIAQVFNYYLLGRSVKEQRPVSEFNRYLFLFVLSCFTFTEVIIAMDRPAMWLYVGLNIWGFIQFFNQPKGK